MMKRIKISLRSCSGKTVRFYRREDGATAVEFALLAMPFFLLLFGIIELAVIFFMQSNVQNAAYEAGRQIRTGEFTGDEAAMKRIICEEMNPNITAAQIPTCSEKLTVQVSTLSDFSRSTNFAPDEPAPAPGTPPPPAVIATQGGDTVLVEVTYRHDLALPGAMTRLSNGETPAPGVTPTYDPDSYRNLKVITAFRNEPF